MGSKKYVWETYLKENPTGIKRTKFYQALESCHFKLLQVLKGLCSLCDIYGFKTFDKLEKLVALLCELVEGSDEDGKRITNTLRQYHMYLRSEFPKHLQHHSATATHCLEFGFSDQGTSKGSLKDHDRVCHQEEHVMDCKDCNLRSHIFEEISALAERVPYQEQLESANKKIVELQETLGLYIGHLMRSANQRALVKEFVEKLKPGQCFVICDYKMKYLFQLFREPSTSWYGKRGASVFGIMYLYLDENGELTSQFYLCLSPQDNKQDWYFSVSSLEAATIKFRKLLPHITEEYRITDNGAHFHNSALLTWNSQYYKVQTTLYHTT